MKKLYFIASAMPVIVAAAFLFWKGDSINWTADILISVLPLLFMIHGIFSRKFSAMIYGFEMLFPFAWIGILSIAGLMPLSTIVAFMTLPIAIACAQTMKKVVDGGKHLLEDLNERTARLQIMFSILLAISFVIARFI